MKAQDLIKQNYPPSILIYGAAGTGKTALVSQLAGGYMFDFDGGMRTAATLKDAFTEARNAITFDTYVDEDPYKPKMLQQAEARMRDVIAKCGARKWEYDACVIDSITGFCRMAQLHEQAAQGDPFKKMEIQDWGKLVNDLEKFLTLMRSLHVLVVATAHMDFLEKSKTDSRGRKVLGETEITNMFPASATKKHGFKSLVWLFDEVLYSDTRPAGGGKLSYRVRGAPEGVIMARTRSQIGTIVHNEIGMVGLLEKMGFKYGGAND